MKHNEGDLVYKVNNHFGGMISWVLEAFHLQVGMQTTLERGCQYFLGYLFYR